MCALPRNARLATLAGQRLSNLHVYVCPVCYQRLRRRVPGAEPGQRFDVGDDQGPMEVVQRRGLNKVLMSVRDKKRTGTAERGRPKEQMPVEGGRSVG